MSAVTHPWNGWIAMVGDHGFERTTARHYAWLDYITQNGCDHPAVDCNGTIELVSCERCHAALDSFAAVPSSGSCAEPPLGGLSAP